MDITDALAPASDQLDAVELVNPRTFTIDTGSSLGKRDGKTVAEIRLVGFPRVWRPSKGMLDVLATCWGTDAKRWVGHRVTLYNDHEVMFGPNKVGGIRISHLSHIDKARTVTIRASGVGRKQQWPVKPLPQTPQGESPRGATQGAGTPGAGKVEGADVGASSTPPPADHITPDHEAIIGSQMLRAGIDRDRIMELARQVTGRKVNKSRELSSVEADALIVLLTDLPDGAEA